MKSLQSLPVKKKPPKLIFAPPMGVEVLPPTPKEAGPAKLGKIHSRSPERCEKENWAVEGLIALGGLSKPIPPFIADEVLKLPDSVNTTSPPTSLSLIMSVARADPAANSMTARTMRSGNFRLPESCVR